MTGAHTYPFSDLRADYIRGAIGTAICITPTVAGVGLAPGVWILLGCAMLFAVYLVRTGLKQMTRIEVDDRRILMAHLGSISIPWDDLAQLRLSYFSTWRRGGKGWMQLRLKGKGLTVRIDSTLDEFDEIVKRAVGAASRNRLSFDEPTVRNLNALGIQLPDWDDEGALRKEGVA